MTTKKVAKKAIKKVATKTVPAPEAGPSQLAKLPIGEAHPDAPGLDSNFGDKDPDLVRWLYNNHPEEFAIRYAGRKTVMDPKPKRGEPSLTQQCLKAQRDGFIDADMRNGYSADEHGYTGMLKKEYTVGYKNAGGTV